jgi:ferrochelatase
MTAEIGVLLVNLGTPDAPEPGAVRRYLNEFLTDRRVITFPWLKRQLLVRGLIVPGRYRQSCRQYQEIWMEEGSPLLVYGRRVEKELQKSLGDMFHVELAMRYQTPPIRSVLDKMKHLKQIVVVPLYPQYASASTGSVHEEVLKVIKEWQVIPELRVVNSYPTHPGLIDAFMARVGEFDVSDYDHLLFSFHGLPQKQLKAAYKQCQSPGCCDSLNAKNQCCYSAQCYATARALVGRMKLSEGQYTVCFQSRLGKDPWIGPYTDKVLTDLAVKGAKRLLVMCPAFVCDCLETIYEVEREYGQLFKELGGERLDLVPGLNDHPAWIDALSQIVLEKIPAISRI